MQNGFGGKSIGIGEAPALPGTAATQFRSGSPRLWAAVVLVVGTGLLAYQVLARFAVKPGPSAGHAFLKVDQQGTDLRISWNHSVAPVARAEAGLLWIRDGVNLPQQLHLDANQLRTGSLLYSPVSNQVLFRLDLREPDGHNVSESLLALTALPLPGQVNEMSQETSVLPRATGVIAPQSTPEPAAQSPAQRRPAVAVKSEADPLNTPQAGPTPKESGTSIPGFVPGRLVQQIVPDVPRKARDTIRGKVRVRIRVLVDPSGNVVGAAADAPGPSRYFAHRALEAARQCKFSPAIVDGHAVPSEWNLRFEFGRTATELFPAPVSSRP